MLSRANIVKSSFSMKSLFNCWQERVISVVFPFPFANAGSSIALPAVCESTLVLCTWWWWLMKLHGIQDYFWYQVNKWASHCVYFSNISLKLMQEILIFCLVWEKTLLGCNRPKGLSFVRKSSGMAGQWLQFLPGHWTSAGFSSNVQTIAQTWYPVVWAGAVSWFSSTDLVLSSSSSMSWKYEFFSGKLPWPDWDIKYFCQLNFAIHT